MTDHRYEALHALQYSDAWTLLRETLEAQVKLRQRQVLKGKLSPEDYAARCGEIRGLELALEMPERLMRENVTDASPPDNP